jgi:hypothetical protein
MRGVAAVKITKIEELTEGCVLTFGDRTWKFSRHDHVERCWFAGSGGEISYTRDEVLSFIGWGAIEKPQEPITRDCKVRSNGGIVPHQGYVAVPEEFANESELEVTFRRVKS